MPVILIVDDDPDLVDACSRFLTREGFEVEVARSRAEGMQAVESREPDLIILDVMMQQPDDGIAMARDLRRMEYDRPIIMLTSLSRVTGMEYGADDEFIPVDMFLEKPVTRDELVARVQDLLAR
jgi:DNA-binding response OmpR family regulator